MRGFTSLLCLVGGLSVVSVDGGKVEETTEDSRNIHNVPSFSVTELRTGSRSEELVSVLRTTGLLSIQLDDEQRFDQARQGALRGLCQCTNSREFRSMEGTDSSTLRSDPSTVRTTFATATVGNTPLSLPHDVLSSTCGVETTEKMDLLRDYVAHASKAFVSALDRLLLMDAGRDATTSPPPPLLRTIHGGSYSTVSSIVKASKNLEHFHVYAKRPTAADTKVLDVHTDAGLFLAFVPGLSCLEDDDSENSTTHFFIKNQEDQLVPVAFPPNSIGIMLGVGAQHWLDTTNVQLHLQATRHAVHMEPGQARAWYGMMHLVPQYAIVQQQEQQEGPGETGVRTFADMQRAMALSSSSSSSNNTNDLDGVSIGCGNSYSSTRRNDMDKSRMAVVKARRRLQHITDGSTCNNVTNFFCWMTCQDIPDVSNARANIDDGKSLYCLEPAVLASTRAVSNAVDSCTEAGVVGAAMNEACIGSWQPTAQGVPSQQVRVDVSPQDLDEPFCYGGTTMYMDGFHWLDPTCVIYLFPSWVLSTPGSIAAACIGTLVFGISLEGVIRARRTTVEAMPTGWRQVGVSTLFYGMQLTMGYMLMLVVMTYSWPLFLCVVVGIMMGHVCFNNPWINKRVAESKRDADACNTTNHTVNEPSSDLCVHEHRSADTSETFSIPEGSTPCCQHAM